MDHLCLVVADAYQRCVARQGCIACHAMENIAPVASQPHIFDTQNRISH